MYHLRNNNEFVLPRIKTVNFGYESTRYRGPQLWFSLSQDIRNTESMLFFKSKIKSGTVKNALADYVDLLFQTSDIYDFYDWAFYSLNFMSFLVLNHFNILFLNCIFLGS